MKTALIIPHYYKERRANVSKIVHSVKEWVTKPDEIIVFNNDPHSVLQIMGATVINAGRNFGSMARYAAGLISGVEICVFQDDDLLLGTAAFFHLTETVQKYPLAIVGMLGSDFEPGKTYREKKNVRTNSNEADCNFVLGRVSAMSREVLADVFPFIMRRPELVAAVCNHEDIPASLSRGEVKNKVIPIDFKELDPAGVGLEKKPAHYELRDKILKAYMEL